MEKINLDIHSKKYKIVYDRKKHKKKATNYLKIPYKDHIIIEMWGVRPQFIRNKEQVKNRINTIIRRLRLHAISKYSHQFVPHGVTGFVILEESHLSIHTWPELKYAHLELLTCSKNKDYTKIADTVDQEFKPEYFELAELVY